MLLIEKKIEIEAGENNKNYLKTKKDKLGHYLEQDM
jgi:GTP cyclohydrolase II